jgi:DNA-binding transcriptional LysR family regulator
MANRRYDIPPLDFLQGFEAAARTLSFTKAADELHITQSAVSRQIKALEEHLGVPLFVRRPRAIELTEQGQTLLRAVSGALALLDEATQSLKSEPDLTALTVTTTTGFASLWLIPRLARFTVRNPSVDVRISATTGVLNLERSRVDLAIRYARPEAAPPDAPQLFSESIVPVCSPLLAADGRRPLRSVEDLSQHTLLYYDYPGMPGSFMDWGTWLTARGCGALKAAGAMHFNQYDQLIQAATNGQGVALGQRRLVSDLIRSGRLVVPFEAEQAGDRAYFLVVSPASKAKPHVKAFIDWLLAEAEDDLAQSK